MPKIVGGLCESSFSSLIHVIYWCEKCQLLFHSRNGKTDFIVPNSWFSSKFLGNKNITLKPGEDKLINYNPLAQCIHVVISKTEIHKQTSQGIS